MDIKMTLLELLKTLQANYRLDIVLLEAIKKMIVESGVEDYNTLFKEILSSKSFDTLSKVSDGIAKAKKVPQLDSTQLQKVSSFSEKLYKKTCDIFDQINWEIQAEGRDLAKYDIPAMFEPEELKVLVKVGKRDRLMYLARHDKHELEDRIFAVVRDLTVMKVSSTKAIKEDGSDTLKRLENGKR
jgi:hypothetical protein